MTYSTVNSGKVNAWQLRLEEKMVYYFSSRCF